MFKVLITDPISDNGTKILENNGIKVLDCIGQDDTSIKNIIPEIDAWIIRSGTKINKNLISMAKKLKVIGRAGVGVDNIDIDSATENGIVVMNVPDGNTISAAEHTMALLSALSRNIQTGHLSILQGQWKRSELVGNELKGKVLGIVGLGKIGREVMKRAVGYEMKIIGFDPYVNKNLFDPDQIKIVDFSQILIESDYISVHVPLIESTRNLFNYENLSKLKASCRIVNVARGGIINELDLANALNNEIIKGAAIDVFESEPISQDNPLMNAKNILLTPHLGASTSEAKEGVSNSICNQIVDFLKNDKLTNAINLPLTDMGLLKSLAPYLKLGDVIGKFLAHLVDSPIISLNVEGYGDVEEIKPVMLSVLMGLLDDFTDTKINYVNVLSIAEERGISLKFSYNTQSVSYSNLFKVNVKTHEREFNIDGCVFEKHIIKFTKIMNHRIDVTPEGPMLLIQNKDIPGVVGNIGTLLGSLKINIAEFILSRQGIDNKAYSLIKIDEAVNMKLLKQISDLDEIISIKQILIND